MVWYSGFRITKQKCSEQDIEVLRVTQRWCVSMGIFFPQKAKKYGFSKLMEKFDSNLYLTFFVFL